MIAIGLDGCPDGWVVVRLNGSRQDVTFIESLDALSDIRFDHAAIDMPIGLPDAGYRACDLVARHSLGAHRSRVFPGARRCVIDARFHSAAEVNVWLKDHGEPGISLQLWYLRNKLTELDAFVRRYPVLDLREAHPELVFRHLNDDLPVASKKTAEGRERRRALLRADGFPNIDALLTQKRRLRTKTDDVLDACAAAVAARDFGAGRVLPPGPVQRDACGLPMQIWY